ncbi:DoxX family membrane protein [Candidatus Viadribacter manganicus]|uniref:DoxX family protein n=1 Tax=Candidatus Viadribacter manganicus TaxID=1759059 RepID=A0A1B1ALY5_9PROT|nr:DoxX family membrane protein [Candidatus Viadribacter manganicus]ANP47579.1 DoxX family protein [Candidatus Viadribacter manganicus]
MTLALDLDTAWKAIVTLLRLILGAWMIISGFSYWAPHFGLEPAFPQPLGTLPLSNQMLVTMIEVGLFDFVKTCEIVGGLCLIFGVFVPFATVLLLPISAIVFYNAIGLNVRTERLFDMTYLGVSCLYMNIIVALGYIRYYVPMLTFRSSPGSVRDLGHLPNLFDPKN